MAQHRVHLERARELFGRILSTRVLAPINRIVYFALFVPLVVATGGHSGPSTIVLDRLKIRIQSVEPQWPFPQSRRRVWKVLLVLPRIHRRRLSELAQVAQASHRLGRVA